jgi:hypothetical protein
VLRQNNSFSEMSNELIAKAPNEVGLANRYILQYAWVKAKTLYQSQIF